MTDDLRWRSPEANRNIFVPAGLMTVAGFVWLGWGAFIFSNAVGGIHEVYAAIMVSFGVLFVGLGGLLHQLKMIAARQMGQERSDTTPAETTADSYWRPSAEAQAMIEKGKK